MLTAIDLFSGPGGLAIGMKRAGISPVMGVEFNKDAVATYRTHTDSDHRFEDIRAIDFTPYQGRIDVVYGGPPCQPFSMGGVRQGHNDERDMVPQFVRAVSQVQPAAFLMENVPGLITTKYRSYFDWMLQELESIGFSVAWRVVSAADFGVPQSRKRVIVVGMRHQEFLFPAPSHGEGAGLHPYIASSAILGAEPLGEPAKSPVVFAPRVSLRPNPYHGHIYKGGGRPIDPNAPCQTIYASAGGNKTHWVDVEGIVPGYHAHLKAGGTPREGVVPGARRLSVEESSLLQTFPDDLVFQGSRSSQYTQVGDAVPPLLAEALGTALAQQLLGIDGEFTYSSPQPVQQRLL